MIIAAPDLSYGNGVEAELQEQRSAPRFTSLIRAAKLVCGHGEFVCVLRDVSSAGVRLRCFHAIPHADAMTLELQNGDTFPIEPVREDGCEASFRFTAPVPVERLVQETWHYPRRPLRLNIAMDLTLHTATGSIGVVTRNVSQQGCSIECDLPLAMAQEVVIEGAHPPGIRAKVRWRGEGACGLVFDDTFTLEDFARYTARVQCPALVVR